MRSRKGILCVPLAFFIVGMWTAALIVPGTVQTAANGKMLKNAQCVLDKILVRGSDRCPEQFK